MLRVLAIAPLLLLALLLGDLVGILRGGAASPTCPSDAALVMGAAQYDGRPSPAFERRLVRALELYEADCIDRIVVSGGRRPGDRTTEGSAGRTWLIARGVPAPQVVAEEAARTSVENVRNSADALSGGNVVVVSDDLHVWRASWLARREGLDVSAAATRADGDRGAYLLREWMAMAAYRLGIVR